ncbi:MAG: RNA polymerase sigma factor [Candidatus Falkowbacteria bacterium]
MKRFLQEKLLLAKLKSLKQDAFTELYDQYVDRVYRFVYFKVGNAEEAEDLTSLTFLKTWQHLSKGELTDSKTLPALVYRVARNAIIDHYRQKSRVEIVSMESPEAEEVQDATQVIAEHFDQGLQLEQLKNKLGELKDEYREVIILKYIDELSNDEIATILDKSKGNVRVLIFRATQALRDLVEPATKSKKQ